MALLNHFLLNDAAVDLGILTGIRNCNVQHKSRVSLCGFGSLDNKFLQIQRKKTNITNYSNRPTLLIQVVSIDKPNPN